MRSPCPAIHFGTGLTFSTSDLLAAAGTAGMKKIQCSLCVLLDLELTIQSRFPVKYPHCFCGAAFSVLKCSRAGEDKRRHGLSGTMMIIILKSAY